MATVRIALANIRMASTPDESVALAESVDESKTTVAKLPLTEDGFLIFATSPIVSYGSSSMIVNLGGCWGSATS